MQNQECPRCQLDLLVADELAGLGVELPAAATVTRDAEDASAHHVHVIDWSRGERIHRELFLEIRPVAERIVGAGAGNARCVGVALQLREESVLAGVAGDIRRAGRTSGTRRGYLTRVFLVLLPIEIDRRANIGDVGVIGRLCCIVGGRGELRNNGGLTN